MTKLTFTTTPAWDLADGFGCASLGLPGLCDNSEKMVTQYPTILEGKVLTGSYAEILAGVGACKKPVQAAVILFGNAGGENGFMAALQGLIQCPMVGGGAAIDGATGRNALIPGSGEAAVFLITDQRFTYQAVTHNIHNHILGQVQLTLQDPRTIRTIEGVDAATFLAEKRRQLGLAPTDFEHLTLSDLSNVNAHLSCVDGVIKSGRDLCETMLLRYVDQNDVYAAMADFYRQEDAIVFGCAGLSGLLDQPLDTHSLGLFLFGEVCTVDHKAEFGNLMLSKLVIKKK